MSVTTGNFGVTATPATDLYNLLATALTNNGNWTETADSPVSAVNAGTTDIVRCWKNNLSPNWFLMIEVDDTNSRLRIRATEELGVGGGASNPAQYKVRKFVDGHSSIVSVTANADTTAPAAGADQSIGASSQVAGNACLAYTQINVSVGGFPYLFEVRNQIFTVATRVAGLNYYCIAGIFPSLVQTVTDSVPLFLMGSSLWPGMNNIPELYNSYSDSTNASTTQPVNGCKSSRSPNCGTLSGTLFSWVVAPLYGMNTFTYPVGTWSNNDYYDMYTNWNIYGAINGGTPHKHFNSPIASPAVIHGLKGQVLDHTHVRTFRAYMPDFVTVASAGAEPTLLDTLTVNGVVYYPLGWTIYGLDSDYGDGSHAGMSGLTRIIVAVKA